MDKPDEKTLRSAVETLNAKIKCFRHQFQPTTRRCRLCDAKTEAKGRFEYARRIFVGGFYGRD